MGEVYKARDTRLERTVAVKISSTGLSERFRREAQAIASLNHPHICTLYDVGADYLVMEYIDGAPLKGPLELREALSLATQIAEAVNHAHRQGVIHRDLKPSNILVTRTGAKVLDFGLAKFASAASVSGGSLEATLTRQALTHEGTILGTPQYMAPEQVEGQEADARADVFAFGAVLYEMITGRMAFSGKTHANVIAAVLAAEPPPVTNFQPLIPPALDHLIRTCLAKDPADRRQSMHDVLLELRWIAEGGSQAGIPKPLVAHRKRRERLSWIVTAAVSAAAAVLAVRHFSEKPPAIFPVRFEQPLPAKVVLNTLDIPAISPDGRMLAWAGASPQGKTLLWLRRMESVQSTTLPGTENAAGVFWSADSRFLTYVADGKLQKVDTAGGSPQMIGNALPSSYGGSWNAAGVIVLGRGRGPVYQIPAAGGEPRDLLKLDPSRREIGQILPQFLPDGRHFIYTSLSTDAGSGGIYVSSLDQPTPRRISTQESNARFAPPGYLLFARANTLVAQRFDTARRELTGEPQVVAEGVGIAPLRTIGYFSASDTGALVYRADVFTSSQLAWFDRSGRRLQSFAETRQYVQGTLSPDEKRFAVQIGSGPGTGDIWMLDLATGILSRVTSDPHTEDTPVWSPDGREIAFCSNRNGPHALYRKVVGGGDEQQIRPSTEPVYPAQYLKDGSLLYMNQAGRSFFRLPPGPNAQPEILLKTDYSKDGLRISPDGRWAAYNTNESGRWEVYVASFPAFTERRQVSKNGGVQGYWRKDGRELFYLDLEGALMSVPVKAEPSLETGIPQTLFQTRIAVTATADQFSVSGDGQRFLLLEPTASEAKPFTVILNWPALLRN